MYTTKKKIDKLTNQQILSWLIIGLALIRLAFKDYHSFNSFQAIGNFLDVLIMIGLGITFLISSKKRIKKIEGIEFDINETEFIYKTPDEELRFTDDSPAKYIKKTLKTIEICTHNDRKILLKLDDFLLDFKELKKINGLIPLLNGQFQVTTATNQVDGSTTNK